MHMQGGKSTALQLLALIINDIHAHAYNYIKQEYHNCKRGDSIMASYTVNQVMDMLMDDDIVKNLILKKIPPFDFSTRIAAVKGLT